MSWSAYVSSSLIVIVIVFVFDIVFIFGHIMSPHHSDQMSKRSQVSKVALCGCSLNVFVFDFDSDALVLVQSTFQPIELYYTTLLYLKLLRS